LDLDFHAESFGFVHYAVEREAAAQKIEKGLCMMMEYEGLEVQKVKFWLPVYRFASY
jgi:hypothetical protein